MADTLLTLKSRSSEEEEEHTAEGKKLEEERRKKSAQESNCILCMYEQQADASRLFP